MGGFKGYATPGSPIVPTSLRFPRYLPPMNPLPEEPYKETFDQAFGGSGSGWFGMSMSLLERFRA